MRIAIITESFPPDVNGVAHCVVRVAENLVRKGHQPLIIAPDSGRGPELDAGFPFPVERVPSVPLPGYPSFRLGLPSPATRKAIAAHGTEIVHLASPVALGAWGARVARAERLPVVAVFQTDLPSYARAYHLGRVAESFTWHWLRDVHNTAGRTLAPSNMTAADLEDHGIERIRRWGRGVDTERFQPSRRDEVLRAALAPNGEVIVGYVGRLAIESGLPVVAPASGGPLDLVDDRGTGYLVPPGDPDALSAAVHKLSEDAALRARLGAAARRRVLGRTWSALTDELLGHYAAVIEADAPPARLAA